MQIISADSHLDLGWLPPDTFTSRVSADWQERVPRIAETADGPRWVAGTAVLSGVSRVGSLGREYLAGVEERLDKIARTGLYDDGLNRPTNPEMRLRDQDLDGVAAEVIYGIFGVSMQLTDLELASVVNVAFNDWMAEFCATNPQRYIGLANLPLHEARAAAAELRRAVDLGFRGAVLDVNNSYRPIYHEDWFPLWAAAVELQIPLSFHATPKRRESPPLFDEPLGSKAIESTLSYACLASRGAMDYFGIIFGGALDVFPDLKVIIAESGIGWIPGYLENLDRTFENSYRTLGLKLKPSEYWQRQMYATFDHDPAGLAQLDLLGEDRVMFGSDYPHPGGVFPDSQQVVQNTMGALPETTRAKIIHDTAAQLYRIG
jgi:predicted TIM-barrel fold metal-dependent hydrolase